MLAVMNKPKQRRRPRRASIRTSAYLCPDKAWLLGFFAGDGNVQIEEDGGAKASANCGQDEQLARHVAELIRQLYGVPCKVRQQRIDKAKHRATDLEAYARLVERRRLQRSDCLDKLERTAP